MMRRALELARVAWTRAEVPVGAVVYESTTGAILAEAHNTRETTRNPAGHAEFLAISAACARRADWRLTDCSLAVTLEPCPMCAGLIVNARVGRVLYGADDPRAGAVRSIARLLDEPRFNHRPAVVGGLHADESRALLTGFFRSLRSR